MNGQSLNRFAYVNGNPVSMVDPTGHVAFLLVAPAVGGFLLDMGGMILATVIGKTIGDAASDAIQSRQATKTGEVMSIPQDTTMDRPSSGNSKSQDNIAKADSGKKERSQNPIAKRKNYSSKKDAYEDAKRAGKGNEPTHHPDGSHGPHYHPDVPMPKGPQTPKAPNPHDHYNYPSSKL